MIRLSHYINGKSVPPASGGWLDVFEPATGEKFADCPAGDGAYIDSAVAAARVAWPMWSSLAASERGRWLNRGTAVSRSH